MRKTRTIFDDQWTGPRFSYGLSYRPLSYANVPPGWIVKSHRDHKDYPFGVVDYPEPLTEAEIKSYQLTPVDEN